MSGGIVLLFGGAERDYLLRTQEVTTAAMSGSEDVVMANKRTDALFVPELKCMKY